MELMKSSSTTTIAEKLKIFVVGSIFSFFVFSFLSTSSIFTSSSSSLSVGQALVLVNVSSTIITTGAAGCSTTLPRPGSRRSKTSKPSSDNSTSISSATTLITKKTHHQIQDSSIGSTSNLRPPQLLGTGESPNRSESYDSKKGRSSCNIFEGKWVYKPRDSPVYDSDQCPFITVERDCQKNGRPDSEYLGWIWQPYDCDIPLFNGTDMLERLRGKKMILVGDSINHNQWMSLACLIYTSIPPSRRQFVQFKPRKFFMIVKDYDFTLTFHMTAFLVHIDYNHPSGRRVLQLNKMDPSSNLWLDADILFFNSAHWWDHPVQQWDVMEYKGKLISNMSKELGYEHALTTWSKWLAKKVNPNKTTVFFRSNAPAHYQQLWCFNSTRPIPDSSFLSNYPRSMVDVAERAIYRLQSRSKFPVKYLNITWLSGYRWDAHPSLYSQEKSKWLELLKEERSLENAAKRKSDCSHWCVPGLPDTWNRLLYVSLFFI